MISLWNVTVTVSLVMLWILYSTDDIVSHDTSPKKMTAAPSHKDMLKNLMIVICFMIVTSL